MDYKYEVEIPRTTFDGLVAFLQQWSRIYSEPNAVVLRGSLRDPFGPIANALVSIEGGAQRLADYYNMAANALGRSKVTKTKAILDLRDLDDEEIDTLTIVTQVAPLRGAQVRALTRVSLEASSFRSLPDMVRVALASLG